MKTKTQKIKTKIARPNNKVRKTIHIKPSKTANRFVITGAVRGAPVHSAFLNNLEAYANHKKAEILVVPIDSGYSITETELDEKLEKYTIVHERRLMASLSIRDFKIKPQMIDPTTGIDRFIQSDSSAFIASPKQRMRCAANSNVQMPKVLQATGVCTQPVYRDNRQGHIAAEDHTIGAIYVETDGILFNFRQLTAIFDGSFIDMGVKYKDKTMTTERADALVLGDLHVGSIDPAVRKATYQLIKELKPRKVIVHDLFDGKSVNHHEMAKLVKRSKDFKETDLQVEIEMCHKELKSLIRVCPKDTEIVIVRSNHDVFLDRYIEAGNWLHNERNQAYIAQLLAAMHRNINPLRFGVEMANDNKPLERVIWLERDEDYKVRGWQLGSHGDLGSNGSRGSIKQTQKSTGRSITGHTHTPEILNETISVGTSTYLKMGYNEGPSSWMNTHAVLFTNAKAQLINIIEGKYKV